VTDGVSGPATDSQLRIWLLGRFRLAVGQHDVDPSAWALRKARSVIKMLALAPAHRLHREQILDALWPDLAPAAAANNLRKVLHVVRKDLASLPSEASGFLRYDAGVVSLSPEPSPWIDVDAFERAAAQARRSRQVGDYRAACDLYRGDLLPDDRYEPWAAERRDALRETYLAISMGMADALQREGRIAEALEVLERVVAMEPTREEGHVRLMRAYAEAGRRPQAIRQYKVMRDVLARDLGVEPEPATQRLYQEILLSRGDDAAPAGAAKLDGGTVSLLFTDIEGSTRMAQRLGDRYAELLAVHHALLRGAFQARGGREVDALGDGFFVAFPRARDAVLAAVDAQRALGAQAWGGSERVCVRIGIHTGEPQPEGRGFVGVDVHRAQRICAAVHARRDLERRHRPRADHARRRPPDGGQHRRGSSRRITRRRPPTTPIFWWPIRAASASAVCASIWPPSASRTIAPMT
jgi:DNA-binding SARP family transcriptional activator